MLADFRWKPSGQLADEDHAVAERYGVRITMSYTGARISATSAPPHDRLWWEGCRGSAARCAQRCPEPGRHELRRADTQALAPATVAVLPRTDRLVPPRRSAEVIYVGSASPSKHDSSTL